MSERHPAAPSRQSPPAPRSGRAGFSGRIPRWFRGFPTWLRAVTAVVSVVLGSVLVWRPAASLGVLALLFGAALVLSGLLELAGGGDDTRGGVARGIRGVVGLLWIASGVFVLLWLGLTVRMLVAVVAAGLAVGGVMGVVSAFRRGAPLDARIASALLGVAQVVFAALALAWPDITLLIVGVVFGARLIMVGLLELWRTVRPARPAADAGSHADPAAHADAASPAAPSRAADAGSPAPVGARRPAQRWARTVAAVVTLAVAVAAGGASVWLQGAPVVVDDFYAAPRVVPDEPGRLIRAEPFSRDVPAGAQAWRILYTTTDGAGEPAVASGLVVVPRGGEGGWPVVDWAHGTTGYAQHCAPSLLPEPFGSGALFVAGDIIDRGWALVATDYLGLGTVGPHPYLIGIPSGHAVLDARRAAAGLADARLGDQTVVWGHSQGGGAALWAGALAADYAPELRLAGVVALAPASDPPALIGSLADVTGGSIFASFAVASYTSIYDDVTYREYIRPGVEPIVRTLAERCLSEPGSVVSILTSLGLSADPEIFATDPTTGALGNRLRENVPPATVSAPLLVAQGGDDTLITPPAQRAFVDGLCADGQRLDYRVYPGLGHLPLVEQGSPAVTDVFAWTADRFAGVAVADGCRRAVP